MTTKFNLNFSESMYRAIDEAARSMDMTMAEFIRDGMSLYLWMIREYRDDSKLLIERGSRMTELLITGLERARSTEPKEANHAEHE